MPGPAAAAGRRQRKIMLPHRRCRCGSTGLQVVKAETSGCPSEGLEQIFVDGSGTTPDADTYVPDVNQRALNHALEQETFLSFRISESHVLLDVLLFHQLHAALEIVHASFELVQLVAELFQQSSELFQIGLVGFLGQTFGYALLVLVQGGCQLETCRGFLPAIRTIRIANQNMARIVDKLLERIVRPLVANNIGELVDAGSTAGAHIRTLRQSRGKAHAKACPCGNNT